MKIYNYYYKSPICLLEIIYDDHYIYKIKFTNNKEIQPSQNIYINEILNETIKQLEDYFNGKLFEFNIPIYINGTEFQTKCWNQMRHIKYGETKTYKEIAELINNPKATRAVGMAANKNILPIIIPCHRIIGYNGKLVGYAGKIWRKEWLLNFEKLNAKNSNL